MSWRPVHADLPCSFCPTVITAGRQAWFSDRGHTAVWCVVCAERQLFKTPPTPPPAAAPDPPPAPAAAAPAQPALFETAPVGRPKLPSADAARLLEEARKRVGAPRPAADDGRFTTPGQWLQDLGVGGGR